MMSDPAPGLPESHLNLFVISGGPGAGKTTVLQELERSGIKTILEVARQIIQEQVRTNGTALPWGDRGAYTDLMLKRSIESYLQHAPASQPTFFDRGIPDTLCYARLIQLAGVRAIESACRHYRYANPVFLAPPWEEIFSTDAERKQDFAEAERTFDLMKAVYQDLGYKTVELPKLSAAERAKFMLDHLNLAQRR